MGIDENGNFGFDFSKEGTSTYYIVCAIIALDKDIPQIEAKVTEMQKTLFGGKEMKSSSIGDKHRRHITVLNELLPLDFQIVVLIADKRKFYEESPLTEYKSVFKKHLNNKLYEAMYRAYPKLKIVEDEYGTSEFQESYREYVAKNRPQQNIFNEYDFDYTDSRNNKLVQIADIIAGSVFYRLVDSSAPNVLEQFRGKITDIVLFPDDYSHFKPVESTTKYDLEIYQLACKTALDYISDHTETNDEDERLRILFLRILLYSVRTDGSSRYIHSTELVQSLSRLASIRVTRDYLYRRIIAPLRDESVLIASSTHGYKIPTKVADIAAYVSQTESVVGPMLSRIGKCRTQIMKATDRELDILGDRTLKAYQRYFGDY